MDLLLLIYQQLQTFEKFLSWLRSKKYGSETEMLRTFNCGVWFQLNCKKEKYKQNKKSIFRGYYTPYQIGHISLNMLQYN